MYIYVRQFQASVLKKKSLDKEQISLFLLFAKAWLEEKQSILNPTIHLDTVGGMF